MFLKCQFCGIHSAWRYVDWYVQTLDLTEKETNENF